MVLMACLYLPDGLIQRPFSFIWKGITGVSFFYLSILIYFAYLVREVLHRTNKAQLKRFILTLTKVLKAIITSKFHMELIVEYMHMIKRTLSPMSDMHSSIFSLSLMPLAGSLKLLWSEILKLFYLSLSSLNSSNTV